MYFCNVNITFDSQALADYLFILQENLLPSNPWYNRNSMNLTSGMKLEYFQMLSQEEILALYNFYKFDFDLFQYDLKSYLHSQNWETPGSLNLHCFITSITWINQFLTYFLPANYPLLVLAFDFKDTNSTFNQLLKFFFWCLTSISNLTKEFLSPNLSNIKLYLLIVLYYF